MITINPTPILQHVRRYCRHHHDGTYYQAGFLFRYFDQDAGRKGLHLAAPVCPPCRNVLVYAYEDKYLDVEICPIAYDVKANPEIPSGRRNKKSATPI